MEVSWNKIPVSKKSRDSPEEQRYAVKSPKIVTHKVITLGDIFSGINARVITMLMGRLIFLEIIPSVGFRRDLKRSPSANFNMLGVSTSCHQRSLISPATIKLREANS